MFFFFQYIYKFGSVFTSLPIFFSHRKLRCRLVILLSFFFRKKLNRCISSVALLFLCLGGAIHWYCALPLWHKVSTEERVVDFPNSKRARAKREIALSVHITFFFFSFCWCCLVLLFLLSLHISWQLLLLSFLVFFSLLSPII